MRRSLGLLFCDLCLIALATLAAFLLRENFELPIDRLAVLLPHFVLTLIVAVPVLLSFSVHRSIWRLSVLVDYMRLAAAAATIVMIATTLGFFVNRLEGVSRSLPVLQGIVMIFMLVGVRVISRQRHVLRQRSALAAIDPAGPRPQDTVLVVGINQISELYLLGVAEFAAHRTAIAGLLGRSERHSGRIVQQQKVLGTPEEVLTVLRELEVHGVFVSRIVVTVAFPTLSAEAREALLEAERSSDLYLDFFAERMFSLERHARESGPAFDDGQAPLDASDRLGSGDPTDKGDQLSSEFANVQTLERPGYFIAKRLFDLGVASVLILATMPLMCVVAFAVAVDVGVPTVFWQQRPGRLGVPFKVFKFRTMRAAHDAAGNRVPDAERSAAIGACLRRFRLDELPQLWHILCGQMSFVGPRPLLPIDQSAAHSARLLVRPGLTGWAQVNGGREVSADDKAALDIWYVRHASMALDLKILFRTVPMVIYGERIDRASIDLARRELGSVGFGGSQ
jgi:lipopolysaccharide/colanic/teichoic acid biosynthesis glycosyltransferase